MNVSTLASGCVVVNDSRYLEVKLSNGEVAIYSRDHYEKLLSKQWEMENAFIHVPWRSIPAGLPLVARLWAYFWMQRAMQQREDVTIRHSMLTQWGFTESPGAIRKALHRMEQSGLVKLLHNGRQQLRVVLTEARPPSRETEKAATKNLSNLLVEPATRFPE